LAAVPQEVRASVCVVPKGPVTFLEIAKKAVGEAGERNRLEQARQMLEQQMLSVNSSDKDFLKALKEIGNQLYIKIGPYWSKTDEAASPLAENADVLRLLLCWLESEGVNAGLAHTRHHLLTATEAVARLSPGAFAVVADPDVWEPILTE